MDFFKNILEDWSERLSDLFSSFSDKIGPLTDSKITILIITILAIVGCLLLFIAFFKMRKVKLNAKMITNIGIAIALAVILNTLRIYHFPQGGSITLGCMIPILIIAFAYGPEVGFLAGFIYGLINFITDPSILHPVQVLFDYPLPSLCIGLAGYFRNNRIVGVIIAFIAKFICHFISGVVFFGSFAPEGVSPIIYSLSVNLPIVGIEGLICIVLIKLLPLDRILKIVNPNYTQTCVSGRLWFSKK